MGPETGSDPRQDWTVRLAGNDSLQNRGQGNDISRKGKTVVMGENNNNYRQFPVFNIFFLKFLNFGTLLLTSMVY